MEIEKTLDLLVTAVTNLNENMNMRFDHLDVRMDKLEDRMDKLEGRMDRLETDVAGLKTDVAELKTDVAELKTDVAELKLQNENHILPAIKVMGENWPALVEEVHTVHTTVEKLAEIQEVNSTVIEMQANTLRLLRAKSE